MSRYDSVEWLPQPGVSLQRGDGRIAVTGSGHVMTAAGMKLPDGLWLTDFTICEAARLAGRRMHCMVHADGWLGAEWKRIAAELGVSAEHRDGEVRYLAELSGRVIRLSMLAVAATGCGNRRSFSRLSLAYGLADFMRPTLLWSRPKPTALCEPSRWLLKFGIGNPVRTHGYAWFLTAYRPGYSYLAWLAEQPVPGGRVWRQLKLRQQTLSGRLAAQLKSSGRPVILVGDFSPHRLGGSLWSRSLTRSAGRGMMRKWFTLPEALRLAGLGLVVVDAAFVGPVWRHRSENTVFGNCAGELARAGGGIRVVRNSWSARLAAENLIRAVCDSGIRRSEPAPMESVWIAAHDRMQAIPAVEAVEAEGGAVLAAIAGSVTFAANDASAAVRMADALWRRGMHLAPGCARRLRAAGVKPNADINEFGGTKSDRSIAVASQLGLCGLVRRLDELTGTGVAGRSRKLKELEAMLAGLPS